MTVTSRNASTLRKTEIITWNRKTISNQNNNQSSSWVIQETPDLVAPVHLNTISHSFNSLSRVLCSFHSRYLSAIGVLQVYLALDDYHHPLGLRYQVNRLFTTKLPLTIWELTGISPFKRFHSRKLKTHKVNFC